MLYIILIIIIVLLIIAIFVLLFLLNKSYKLYLSMETTITMLKALLERLKTK